MVSPVPVDSTARSLLLDVAQFPTRRDLAVAAQDAAAGEGGAAVAGLIRVEPLLHGPRREGERLAARGGLDRLEVQPVDRARAYERLDLGDDLRREGFCEPPFGAAACAAASGASRWASAHCSQARQ